MRYENEVESSLNAFYDHKYGGGHETIESFEIA